MVSSVKVCEKSGCNIDAAKYSHPRLGVSLRMTLLLGMRVM